MQYCPAEDLLPRDGQIVNVSERGAGILARELHQDGERITVNFPLPGEGDPLTATGIVRWAGAAGSKNRWHALGLEWLPLEETTRSRLHKFLYSGARGLSGGVTAEGIESKRFVLAGAIIASILISGLVVSWMITMDRENRELETSIQHRNMVIHRLQREGNRLQQELGSAKVHLVEAAGEVARLDQQTRFLGGEAGRFQNDAGQFQQSYTQARDERDQLMQRVLDLEQERLVLSRRLTSIPELRAAIREAVERRRKVEEAERRARIQAIREAERQRLANGNRGYLIREGRDTTVSGEGTVWIKVHDPESALQTAPSP